MISKSPKNAGGKKEGAPEQRFVHTYGGIVAAASETSRAEL